MINLKKNKNPLFVAISAILFFVLSVGCFAFLSDRAGGSTGEIKMSIFTKDGFTLSGTINDKQQATVRSTSEDITINFTEKNDKDEDIYSTPTLKVKWEGELDINKMSFTDPTGAPLSSSVDSNGYLTLTFEPVLVKAGESNTRTVKVVLDSSLNSAEDIANYTISTVLSEYEDGLGFTDKLSIDLKLIKKAAEVEISYDANGGNYLNAGTQNEVTYLPDPENNTCSVSKGVYEEPTREGYTFEGWYTDPECKAGNEFKVVEYVNRDGATDLTVYAKWEKAPEPLLAKWNVLGVIGLTDFNGVGWDEYNQPIDEGQTDFHQYKRSVTELEFATTYKLPDGFDTSAGYGPWDVSDEQNGSVMAYVVENGMVENWNAEVVTAYKVYICNNQEVTKKVQKVIANPISSYAFNNFNVLRTVIGGANLDMSRATTTARMFWDTYLLETMDVSTWNMGNVINAWEMFCYGGPSVLDVSRWDVSKLENAEGMFRSTNMTSLDVSEWDVLSLKNAKDMFSGNSQWTELDVSGWQTGTIENLDGTFSGLVSVGSLDVSQWNTQNATNMSDTFASCWELTSLDVSGWTTDKVTDISGMFYDCENISTVGDLSRWNTSNVEDFTSMFAYCHELDSVDVSGFNTNKAKSLRNMFSYCQDLKSLDLSSFTFGAATDDPLRGFADNCDLLSEITFGNGWGSASFPTAGYLSYKYGMFYAKNLIPTKIYFAEGTSDATIQKLMNYYWSNAIRKGENTVNTNTDNRPFVYTVKFNANNSTATGTMADQQYVYGVTQTLSENAFELSGYDYIGWNTNAAGTGSSYEEKSNIHSDLKYGADGYANALFDVSDMAKDSFTLYAQWEKAPDPVMAMWNVLGTIGFSDFNGVEWDEHDQPIDENHTDFHQYKRHVTEIEILTSYRLPTGFDTTAGYGPWDVSDAQDQSVMAYVVQLGTYVDYDDIEKPYYKVYICNNQEVTKKEQKVIANPVSSYVFNNFNILQTFSGGENLDMSRATTVDRMFWDCYILKSMNVSNWDMGSVSSAWEMFRNSGEELALDVSEWDVSSLKNGNSMFCYTGITTLDVSKWNTKSLENATSMFCGVYGLKELDVSKWNTSNIITLEDTFNSLEVKVLDVKRKTINAGTKDEYIAWDTSKLTNTSGTFAYCESLESLDVSDWKMNLVTDASSMFVRCGNLKEIDVSKWETPLLENTYNMFANCSALESIDVSNFTTDHVTDFRYMFGRCSSLTTLDVSNFDTSSAGSGMLERFAWDCHSLVTITLGPDFGQATNISAPGASDGLFYVSKDGEYTTTNLLPTTINNANGHMLQYLWNTDHRDAKLYEDGKAITHFTVTYVGNGGSFPSGSNTNAMVYTCDTTGALKIKMGEYNDPSLDGGYTFLGWYTDRACSDGSEFNLSNTPSNVTVYAKWKIPTYTVTYNAMGGQFTDGASTNTVTYNPGGKYISKTANLDDDGSVIDVTGYGDSKMFTETFTTPGVREQQVTITFATESSNYDWVAIYDGSVIPSSTNYGSSITKNRLGGGRETTTTKEYTIPGGTVQFFFKSDSSISNFYGYYATVLASPSVVSGTYADPTLNGAAFAGWYTDPSCADGTEYDPYAQTTDTTVYARWTTSAAFRMSNPTDTAEPTAAPTATPEPILEFKPQEEEVIATPEPKPTPISESKESAPDPVPTASPCPTSSATPAPAPTAVPNQDTGSSETQVPDPSEIAE